MTVFSISILMESTAKKNLSGFDEIHGNSLFELLQSGQIATAQFCSE